MHEQNKLDSFGDGNMCDGDRPIIVDVEKALAS